jgi:competence protein ComEA
MFALTEEERRVILFLTTVALIGLGINFLAKRYSPVKSLVCLNANFGKININKADKEALISILGIGKNLAEAIIEYRWKNLKFSGIEELQNIKGIKGYKFEKLKEFICTE